MGVLVGVLITCIVGVISGDGDGAGVLGAGPPEQAARITAPADTMARHDRYMMYPRVLNEEPKSFYRLVLRRH
jgi:hypothetical protein